MSTGRKNWFGVDPDGLAAILERRGKAWALFELLSNAWDAAGVSRVAVTLEPVAGRPVAVLTVTDDSPEGWADVADSFTMFARSRRGSDPAKRGRFGLGEKLVLACCNSATIATTTGTVHFTADGRRQSAARTERGTAFTAELRMTREELAEVDDAVRSIIPPAGVATTYNGTPIVTPAHLARFAAKLPTVVADDAGNLRPTSRTATITAYPAPDGVGQVLELGVPVAAIDCPWTLDVGQKIPLGMDRDALTDGFRRALTVAANNALADKLTAEQAAEPWATEAIADPRATPAAVAEVVRRRFGDRALIATVGDPVANSNAERAGYTVVHGGSLPAGAWANVRKSQLLSPTSAAFPSPSGGQLAAAAADHQNAERFRAEAVEVCRELVHAGAVTPDLLARARAVAAAFPVVG